MPAETAAALDPRLQALEGGLIASCQPVRGGVFDAPDLVARFALAALHGGAAGLRVEGLADLRGVRAALRAAALDVCIVGLVKRSVAGSDVFITPEVRDAIELIAAGADVVAFDATDRPRPVPVATMLDTIHAGGALAMADVATAAEGRRAFELGADLVASTLSGYVAHSPQQDEPDLVLVETLAAAGVAVVAEGRIATRAHAAEARRRGAFAVTIGTAFSRPELIVGAFVDAVTGAVPERGSREGGDRALD